MVASGGQFSQPLGMGGGGLWNDNWLQIDIYYSAATTSSLCCSVTLSASQGSFTYEVLDD